MSTFNIVKQIGTAIRHELSELTYRRQERVLKIRITHTLSRRKSINWDDMHTSKQAGDKAENLARQYLEKYGLKLIKQNFHSRFGEIDLIMRDGKSIVFIEVKQRRAGLGTGFESITPAKQRKLVQTAQYYLLILGYEAECRFDAVALDYNYQIEWLKNVIIL